MADEMRVRGNQNIQNPVRFLRASVERKGPSCTTCTTGHQRLTLCRHAIEATASTWPFYLEGGCSMSKCWIRTAVYCCPKEQCSTYHPHIPLTTSAMLARGAATSSISFLCCGIFKRLRSLLVFTSPPQKNSEKKKRGGYGGHAFGRTKPRAACVHMASMYGVPLHCQHSANHLRRRTLALTAKANTSDGVRRGG